MVDQNPTTGELYKAKAVTEDEVATAVDVFMRDATTGLFRFAGGYSLDLAAVIRADHFASRAVVDLNATEIYRRSAVRTAILLARPQKA